MFYKLSFKNVKKSFKDYAIYFVTLILGVCVFYIFNSMDSQTAILEINKRQGEMIELLVQILSYVSVFISFILGFLIIYASKFLMKKRNKEFGIYLTLGMSKRKVSLLLLTETFIIGIISLVVGLLLGIVLSQLTSIFVANMFEADMSKFTFNYSSSATIKTIIYFGIIYLIVMIFNTISISKTKLINLINSSKKSEKIKIKNPLICIILCIISIIMLGSAYYMVTGGVEELFDKDLGIILVPISLGVLGTILFYYSISGMILKILSKCKNIYTNKLNTFVFKQINSKINTMIVSISVICIMLFFTLCLLTSAFTIKNYFNSSINKYAQVDFEYIQPSDEKNKISEEEFNNIIEEDKIIKENIKDKVLVHTYIDKNFLYKDSLGTEINKIKGDYIDIYYNTYVEIISNSEYNKLAKIMNLETVNLKDNEYVIVANYQYDYYNNLLKDKYKYKIFGNIFVPKKDKVIEGSMSIGANPNNLGFVVISDKYIDKTSEYGLTMLGNYNTNDQEKIDYMEKVFRSLGNRETLMADTRLQIEESAAGLSAIITFVGLYIGIIFLMTSAAILALKELSDCLDDKEKYNILRKIGADEKDINKALFKQSLILFIMPLLLAIIHTIFGLKFCGYILSTIGVNNILDGSTITFILLISIYGLYFIVTHLYSKYLIKEK